eukprot:tig00001030_g6449.t1
MARTKAIGHHQKVKSASKQRKAPSKPRPRPTESEPESDYDTSFEEQENRASAAGPTSTDLTFRKYEPKDERTVEALVEEFKEKRNDGESFPAFARRYMTLSGGNPDILDMLVGKRRRSIDAIVRKAKNLGLQLTCTAKQGSVKADRQLPGPTCTTPKRPDPQRGRTVERGTNRPVVITLSPSPNPRPRPAAPATATAAATPPAVPDAPVVPASGAGAKPPGAQKKVQFADDARRGSSEEAPAPARPLGRGQGLEEAPAPAAAAGEREGEGRAAARGRPPSSRRRPAGGGGGRGGGGGAGGPGPGRRAPVDLDEPEEAEEADDAGSRAPAGEAAPVAGPSSPAGQGPRGEKRKRRAEEVAEELEKEAMLVRAAALRARAAAEAALSHADTIAAATLELRALRRP